MDSVLKKEAEAFLANVYATNNLTPARDSLAAAVKLLKRFVIKEPFKVGDVVIIDQKVVSAEECKTRLLEIYPSLEEFFNEN